MALILSELALLDALEFRLLASEILKHWANSALVAKIGALL
jgi:hypothetical protein